MPADFDTQFALWLTQHGEEYAQGVNVLEFYHPAFGTYWVSDYGEALSLRTEAPYTSGDGFPFSGGLVFEAAALGFNIDLASDNVSTEQKIKIRMDNANGAVTSALRLLDLDDLQIPLRVTYRVYLDTHRTAPAFDPLALFVINVTSTRLAVEVEASVEALPNVASGIRYTLDLFPPLVYI